MRITLEHIRQFQAVVRFKNLNLAAEKTNISPSAISRSIKIIEEDYETALFDRVGRNIILNQAGKDFYERSITLMEEYNSLISNTKDGNIKGVMKIGASHWLASRYFPELLVKVPANKLNSKFEIFSYDSDVSILKVLSGDLDFALCFSPKEHADIDSKTIHQGQLVLCADKKHPLTKYSPKKMISSLDKFPGIIHKPNELVFSCDDHPMFFHFDINPQFEFFWNSDHIAIELMRRNSYWTMMPDLIVENEKDLIKLNHPREWEAPYEVKIIWHKNKKPALVDLLIQ